MRRITKPLALMLALLVAGSAPLRAAEGEADGAAPPNPLIALGVQMLMRGILDEIGPLRFFLDGQQIDLRRYGPPRLLPNGDILIPRKAAPDAPKAHGGEGEGGEGEGREGSGGKARPGGEIEL